MYAVMNIRRKCTLLLIVFAAVTLASSAFAKGAVRSERSERSERESSQRSESRSTEKRDSEKRSEERSSSRSSAPVERKTTPSYVERSTPQTRSAPPRVEENRVRVESREQTRSDTGRQRKEYENLGRIWMQRTERRSDSNRRAPETPRYDRYTSGTRAYYVFPVRYRHYRYDYLPGISYPSLYCHYLGYFPPYIHRDRILFITPNLGITVRYYDLPTYILDYNSPYWGSYYYPERSTHRSLSYALRDIRRAWETEDIDLLTRYVKRGSRIDYYFDGQYTYSVNWDDYREMTLDAMSSIRTVSMDFDRVRQRGTHEAVVYGRHVYRDYEEYWDYRDSDLRSRSTVYVKYTLRRDGNNWYITEVGSSLDPLY